MARLAHNAEELFARAYAELGNATEAYLRVNPDATRGTAGVNGHKMLHRESVQARIADIKAGWAKANAYTAEKIAKKLEKAYDLAESLNKPDPMIRAAMGLADLYGLLETKVSHTHTMRPEEARQVIRSLLPKYSDQIEAPRLQ